MAANAQGTRWAIERWRMAGVLLWRGGLVFVAGHVCYLGAWQLIQRLNWPVQVTAGLALSLTGLALVMVSLVLERLRAARVEGYLLDD